MQLNPYQDLPWEQLMPTARRKLLCSDKDYMFVLMAVSYTHLTLPTNSRV